MDGIIVINKEKKCTSHDVVRRAKKVFNEKIDDIKLSSKLAPKNPVTPVNKIFSISSVRYI